MNEVFYPPRTNLQHLLRSVKSSGNKRNRLFHNAMIRERSWTFVPTLSHLWHHRRSLSTWGVLSRCLCCGLLMIRESCIFLFCSTCCAVHTWYDRCQSTQAKLLCSLRVLVSACVPGLCSELWGAYVILNRLFRTLAATILLHAPEFRGVWIAN